MILIYISFFKDKWKYLSFSALTGTLLIIMFTLSEFSSESNDRGKEDIAAASDVVECFCFVLFFFFVSVYIRSHCCHNSIDLVLEWPFDEQVSLGRFIGMWRGNMFSWNRGVSEAFLQWSDHSWWDTAGNLKFFNWMVMRLLWSVFQLSTDCVASALKMPNVLCLIYEVYIFFVNYKR